MKPLLGTFLAAAILSLALAFLTGCVAVPIPPFGEKPGSMGTVHVELQVRYEPAFELPEPSSK